MIFLRGNWCSLCTAQLQEVGDRADRLSVQGVAVRFISNQSVEQSRELTEKLQLRADFELMFDRELRMAKGLEIEGMNVAPLGINDYPRDAAMATVVALNEGGLVIFGDETDNYRVRPHPDTFLDAFDESLFLS